MDWLEKMGENKHILPGKSMVSGEDFPKKKQSVEKNFATSDL